MGDEVVLLIAMPGELPGQQPPDAARARHFCTGYDRVDRNSREVQPLLGVPPSMRPFSRFEQFTRMIREEVEGKVESTPAYLLGEVLFEEDFNDGSLAGWTFIEGEAEPLPGGLEEWMSPTRAVLRGPVRDGTLTLGCPVRDAKSGLLFKKDDGLDPFDAHADGRETWFGVTNGRLRLRTSSIQ